MSDQSDFGRLEVQGRTELLVTRFLSSTTKTLTLQSQFQELLWARNKLDGVAWLLAGYLAASWLLLQHRELRDRPRSQLALEHPG